MARALDNSRRLQVPPRENEEAKVAGKQIHVHVQIGNICACLCTKEAETE